MDREDVENYAGGAPVHSGESVVSGDGEDGPRAGGIAAVVEPGDVGVHVVERVEVAAVVGGKGHRLRECGVHVRDGGPWMGVDAVHDVAEIGEAGASSAGPAESPGHRPTPH